MKNILTLFLGFLLIIIIPIAIPICLIGLSFMAINELGKQVFSDLIEPLIKGRDK